MGINKFWIRKQLIILFLLSGVSMLGQDLRDGNLKTYVSNKGRCEIRYDDGKWHEMKKESQWDAEFGDSINLLSAYLLEFDGAVGETRLKSMTKNQFRGLKVLEFRTYKKTINNLVVDCLEFELNHDGCICKYQGFVFNGKGGSVELLFVGELGDMEKGEGSIDEFSGGLSLIN